MLECHQLFIDVQMQGVFKDGKTFVDSVAKRDPVEIAGLYELQRHAPDFCLRSFVLNHFHLPEDAASDFECNPAHSLLQNIEALWPHLTRQAHTPDEAHERDSLLHLPDQYVVPGGRFREIYYWDSYFTMLGLSDGGHHALAESMVRNLAYLIDRHDHVPNGNRSYFLSRSHPPVFFKMVEALDIYSRTNAYVRYLSQLKKEYDYWMAGAEGLAPGEAVRHVVRLPDGSLLNRYWDERDTPRDEMYRDDVQTAMLSRRPHAEVYRDLRAAAESGWDFSSRWNADPQDLSSIETTALLPVDLNCLLHGLEVAVSRGCLQSGDEAGWRDFQNKAVLRQMAIDRFLWNDHSGHYVDYHWVDGRQRAGLTAATVLPLFTGVASQRQAMCVAECISSQLLQVHGLATTTLATGQQWDLPNGWAPLHWMAIDGLNHYHCTELARDIATRWIRTVSRVYRATGKLLEKYDVTQLRPGGGGEYPTQDGFGWTNGVTARLLKLYPTALDLVEPEGVAPGAGQAAGLPLMVAPLPPHVPVDEPGTPLNPVP